MSTDQPDPYAVLGIEPNASSAEITAAYRRALRACHPDTPHPDRDRLASVIAAYRQLRNQPRPPRDDRETRPQSSRGIDIPVRVHHHGPALPAADLRAGPVRRHPSTRNTGHRGDS